MVSLKYPIVLLCGTALVAYGVFNYKKPNKEVKKEAENVAEKTSENKVVPKTQCNNPPVNCLIPPCPDPCTNDKLGLIIA